MSDYSETSKFVALVFSALTEALMRTILGPRFVPERDKEREIAMSGLYLKCSECGGLARPIASTPGVLTCTCGRMKTPLPIPPVDLASIRKLSMSALLRARAMVYPVPVNGAHGEFALSADRTPVQRGGLPRDVAENYAAAINGEAELARSMLNVLAELERLRGQLEALRDQTLADRASSVGIASAASRG